MPSIKTIMLEVEVLKRGLRLGILQNRFKKLEHREQIDFLANLSRTNRVIYDYNPDTNEVCLRRVMRPVIRTYYNDINSEIKSFMIQYNVAKFLSPIIESTL